MGNPTPTLIAFWVKKICPMLYSLPLREVCFFFCVKNWCFILFGAIWDGVAIVSFGGVRVSFFRNSIFSYNILMPQINENLTFGRDKLKMYPKVSDPIYKCINVHTALFFHDFRIIFNSINWRLSRIQKWCVLFFFFCN